MLITCCWQANRAGDDPYSQYIPPIFTGDCLPAQHTVPLLYQASHLLCPLHPWLDPCLHPELLLVPASLITILCLCHSTITLANCSLRKTRLTSNRYGEWSVLKLHQPQNIVTHNTSRVQLSSQPSHRPPSVQSSYLVFGLHCLLATSSLAAHNVRLGSDFCGYFIHLGVGSIHPQYVKHVSFNITPSKQTLIDD